MAKNGDWYKEVMVGIFMLVVLSLLGYFTIVISGVELLRDSKRETVEVLFADAGGLKERDSVMFRGMKVGEVESITLDGEKVKVRFSWNLRNNEQLKAFDTSSFLVSVENLSLLGGKYLKVKEQKEEAKNEKSEKKFAVKEPVEWMEELSDVVRELSQITKNGEIKSIVKNIDETAQNLNGIVAKVSRGEGTVGKLLAQDEMYDEIKSTIGELCTTITSAKNVAAKLESGEGTVGKLLKNDEVYEELKTTMTNAREFSTKFKNFGNELDSNNDGLIMRLLKDKTMAQNAEKILADLSAVSSRLERGEGTLGKITREAELYDEVNSLVKDIRQIVDNYRDTTPITTFGSLIMGGL